MAQTINRNQEITNEDFKFLKKRFKERTGTRALYRCVEFVVNKAPDYEKLIRTLKRENKSLKTKQVQLMEIIIEKQSIDQKNNNKAYPAETD